MTDFKRYRRKQIAELRPYVLGETLSGRVSVSMADYEAGSPKPGDMIARNPKNHEDQWLVAAQYFADNFEEAQAMTRELTWQDRVVNTSLEMQMKEARAEIEQLTLENWQLKGALGYSVPGHIPCGDFKCGLCEARDAEIERLRPALTKIATLNDIRTLDVAQHVASRALEPKP